MPLTKLQSEILNVIAANRDPTTVVAGGIALAREGPRISKDIDIFHASADALKSAVAVDLASLTAAGFTVEVTKSEPVFEQVKISKGAESIDLEWAADSDYRYFPPVRDPDFGYVLSVVDIAMNKIFAAVGRREMRDLVDLSHISERYLPLGAAVAAAIGIDPGYTPEFLLNELSRQTRWAPDQYPPVDDRVVFDPGQAVRTYREHLKLAQEFIAKMPTEALGKIYLLDGKPVQPDPDRLTDYVAHSPARGGHWPLTPGIETAMLEDHYAIRWARSPSLQPLALTSPVLRSAPIDTVAPPAPRLPHPPSRYLVEPSTLQPPSAAAYASHASNFPEVIVALAAIDALVPVVYRSPPALVAEAIRERIDNAKTSTSHLQDLSDRIMADLANKTGITGPLAGATTGLFGTPDPARRSALTAAPQLAVAVRDLDRAIADAKQDLIGTHRAAVHRASIGIPNPSSPLVAILTAPSVQQPALLTAASPELRKELADLIDALERRLSPGDRVLIGDNNYAVLAASLGVDESTAKTVAELQIALAAIAPIAAALEQALNMAPPSQGLTP